MAETEALMAGSYPSRKTTGEPRDSSLHVHKATQWQSGNARAQACGLQAGGGTAAAHNYVLISTHVAHVHVLYMP